MGQFLPSLPGFDVARIYFVPAFIFFIYAAPWFDLKKSTKKNHRFSYPFSADDVQIYAPVSSSYAFINRLINCHSDVKVWLEALRYQMSCVVYLTRWIFFFFFFSGKKPGSDHGGQFQI